MRNHFIFFVLAENYILEFIINNEFKKHFYQFLIDDVVYCYSMSQKVPAVANFITDYYIVPEGIKQLLVGG